jgi:tRNA (mo5U34)-methyltransferase
LRLRWRRARGEAGPDAAQAQERRAAAAQVPFWWHSIDLGYGVFAPGHKTPQQLAAEWSVLGLDDLSGQSVLDIGAWDGFFSFAAERAGAERVVALDFPAWAASQQAAHVRGHETNERNEARPDSLPGRAGFDLAKRLLNSRVEPVVADFTTADLAALGRFDVVLFLGVLYHLEDALEALRRLRALTAGVALIETAAVAIPQHPDASLWEFYPSDELAGDPTNWWAPTAVALLGACRAAGFADGDVLLGPPADFTDASDIVRYRAVVRARVT